ncbi:MAG TPA: hypothetical protein VF787_28770 [Thermoanaerobaculia bacterium]
MVPQQAGPGGHPSVIPDEIPTGANSRTITMPGVMSSRTLVLIVCVAALFVATTVAIVPVFVAMMEPALDAPATLGVATEATAAIQPVALAGDLTFRGPPAV